MDYLRAKRLKETILIVLVGLMAAVANLPEGLLRPYGLDHRYLLAVLGVLVVLALFLYVRFFFFLLYILLAVGANLPDQWAQGLGVSRLPMLVALIVMVVFSLFNHSTKMLPTGLEPERRRKKSPQGIKALVQAIDKGQAAHIQQLLKLEFDLNAEDERGVTPLIAAAAKGDAALVALLLAHRADPALIGRDGLTALEMALKNGHAAVAERLKAARQQAQPPAATPAAATANLD